MIQQKEERLYSCPRCDRISFSDSFSMIGNIVMWDVPKVACKYCSPRLVIRNVPGIGLFLDI